MAVNVDGRYSRPVKITRGVPQGSPLGPLLFSIYYADVVNGCRTSCNLFADDTEFHVFGDSPNDVVNQLNNTMVELKRYLDCNKLELNVKKTVWMLVNDVSNSNAILLYGGVLISRVTAYRYLGFTIDSSLSWKSHIDTIVTKVKQRLYCLRRSKYNVSSAGKLLLFNALIMPCFTYGIEMWFATSRTLRETLELLFRHCLRIILNDVGRIPAVSNAELYTRLNLLPLSLLFQQKLGQMIHKALKLGASPPVKQLLCNQATEAVPSGTSLRARNPLNVPLVRQEGCRARLTFYGSQLWNHLTPSLREATSELKFAAMYRDYLMDWLSENGSVQDPCPLRFYDYV
jgi:hypothetical protein